MSLWGNLDDVSGNQKPLFANTSNISARSTIHGSVANTDAFYGLTMGVSATEMAAHSGKTQHAGWSSIKYGTGPVVSVSQVSGNGINSAGFLILTDTSAHGQGTGANISYTTANSENTLQSYSTNPSWNTYGTFTVVNGGSGYSSASAISVRPSAPGISNGTFTVTLGGRAGRLQSETLVAMGSITGDDPKDNVVFSGV